MQLYTLRRISHYFMVRLATLSVSQTVQHVTACRLMNIDLNEEAVAYLRHYPAFAWGNWMKHKFWTRDHQNMKQESSPLKRDARHKQPTWRPPKLRVCLGFMGPSIWSVCPIQRGRRNGRVINERGDRVTLPRTIISGTLSCCLGDVQCKSILAYSTGLCHRTFWSFGTHLSEEHIPLQSQPRKQYHRKNLKSLQLKIIHNPVHIYSFNTWDYTASSCKMPSELVKV